MVLRISSIFCVILFLHNSLIVLADRTLKGPVYNPGCSDMCTGLNATPNLVYFNSTGSNDTLHFLISSINGLSILLIQTNVAGEIEIDWPKYLDNTADSGSISTNGTVYDSIGVTFNKLYRYNDMSGMAIMDPNDYIIPIPFDNLLWDNATLDFADDSTLILTSNDSTTMGLLGIGGQLQISFQVFGSQGHYNLMPQLLHTETSSQFEITLNNLASDDDNNNTRYALEIFVVSQQSGAQNVTVKRTTSIDDEYTPGTFDTCYISMPNSNTFVLWKPVCYQDSGRSLEKSTPLTYSTPIQISGSGGNLLDAFYGIGTYTPNAFNISFGISGDKAYYTGALIWTLEIGSGNIPVESFSTLVIALLVVCAAVPGVALLGGGSYGIYSRFCKKEKPTEQEKEKEDPPLTERY